MKKVLIISPYFPPSNAADMQRIRTSLPYFTKFGWEATIVTVDPAYSEMPKDPLFSANIPHGIEIHTVKAFSKKLTSRVGLGSLALRALLYYKIKVDELLSVQRYQLIYFSTTQFAVCVLGAYWKSKFGVPYVIDMQDPWHSNYYIDKPKNERPPKYWFSYRLNKLLEPIAMSSVNGLISVSDHYIRVLKARYENLYLIPTATISFGAFTPDSQTAMLHRHEFTPVLTEGCINVVYAGRGGADMHAAIRPLFQALKKGLLERSNSFEKLRFYFIGTSYAPSGQGQKTIMPLAEEYQVGACVTEITDRLSYYHVLTTLQQAQALVILGSDDPAYSPSKIYPYLLSQKPLLAILNGESNGIEILKKSVTGAIVTTFEKDKSADTELIYETLIKWANQDFKHLDFKETFSLYSAEYLTGSQTRLFDLAIENFLGR